MRVVVQKFKNLILLFLIIFHTSFVQAQNDADAAHSNIADNHDEALFDSLSKVRKITDVDSSS